MSFLGNKTQRMHPLYVPVANKADYFFYTAFRRINPFSVIALALLIYSLVGFVGDIRSLFSDSVWDRVLYIAAFILSGVVKVLNLAAHYEDRFTTDEIDKDFFKDVDVPNGDWQRLDLRMGDKETEPVFFSEKIDKLLRSDTPIDIRRDKEYEKRLGTHIRKKENWEATYSKFLRHNHRKAMYSGKQFYNEAKYGLSSDPTPSADPTKPVEAVKIHKTCYFDSYLTNIIPGQVLTRNRDKEVMASALEAGWLPYTAEGEERRLRATGECAMANEPGVTTLCIKENDTIILWRQNHLAQCSTGQLVASGSGSANWGDCRKYLHDPDKNGLRKAVRRGMERELWEESVGMRGVSDRKFYKNLDTRITGYFRWLKKGGKAEFVGVSRLRNSNSMTENLLPEESEVLAGEEIPAGSIAKLKAEIGKRLKKQTQSGARFGKRDKVYSVSCAMALRALQATCQEYCDRDCLQAKEEGCKGDECPYRPFKVLFDEKYIVKLEKRR